MSDESRVVPRRPDDHIDPETISAWLDEPADLSADERFGIEAHLAGCEDCRQVADDLRALVAALAALPEAAVPRPFALGQEHARRPAPVTHREPAASRAASRWYDRQMRALRWATAAAAILFVFVLGIDLATTRFDRASDDDSAPAMSMEQGASGSDEFEAQEATGETMAAEVAPASEQTPEPTSAAASAAQEEATPASADAQATPEADQAVTETDDQARVGTTREDAETRSPSRREERLRLIEFGLATLFVWLLGLMIVLPRLRRWRGNRS